eukprot:scaffold54057_cov28-Phaeocystis_antarctica.AAC.2
MVGGIRLPDGTQGPCACTIVTRGRAPVARGAQQPLWVRRVPLDFVDTRDVVGERGEQDEPLRLPLLDRVVPRARGEAVLAHQVPVNAARLS